MINNYNQEIDEMFQEQDEVSQLQQNEKWAINDLGTAVWSDGIIFENEQKVAEIESIYNQRLEEFKSKLDSWKDSASKKHLNNIEFFKNHLHLFHMRIMDDEKAQGAKKITKTIKLPTRSLTCSKQQPEIFINGKEASKAKDDPAFVDFIRENNPEFIKEEVKWGDFKKTLKQVEMDNKLVYVDENGQPIDFIELVEREEKLDWKLVKIEE